MKKIDSLNYTLRRIVHDKIKGNKKFASQLTQSSQTRLSSFLAVARLFSRAFPLIALYATIAPSMIATPAA